MPILSLPKAGLRLAALLLFSAGFSFAHPTGNSIVDLHVDGDSILARVDVNSAEMLNLSEGTQYTQMGPEELEKLNERIAYYLQTHVRIKTRGKILPNARVVSWSKDSLQPMEKMDSADLADTTYVLKFAWDLPPLTSKVEVQVPLFIEYGIQGICQLSLYSGGQLLQRRWMPADGKHVFHAHPDSLASYAAAAKAEPSGESVLGEEGLFLRFLHLGFTHILPHGLDHILFVLGLFLFSTRMRPLLIQVTAFTVAHSITLGLALLGAISLPARIVEPLIALSIAVVAVENIFLRNRLPPHRWLVVFLFGLVHGMGFAGVLSEFGFPENRFWTTVLSFNLGVELGQLAVIGLAFAATFWAFKKPWYEKRIVYPISGAIALVGLYWAVERLITG